MNVKRFLAIPVLTIVISSHCTTKIEWIETSFADITFFDVIYGNGKFVSLGRQYNNTEIDIISLVSTDGIQWDKNFLLINPGDGYQYNSDLHLKFLTNQFIFWSNTAANLVFNVSPDGITWTTINPDHYGFTDLSWDGSQYIGVGSRDEPWTSTDLAAWTARGTLESYQVTTRHIDKIAHSDTYNYWAGIGRGYLSPQFTIVLSYPVYTFSSTDGISWIEKRQNVQHEFNGISWFNNQFIVYGLEGTIFTSTDGVDWINHSVFLGPLFTDIVFGNGEYFFLASCDSSCEIWSTPDLKSWKIYSYKPTNDLFKNIGAALTSIAFNGTDRFVIVGGKTDYHGQGSDDNEVTGIILTSP